MPPLTLHTAVARRVAERLRLRLLDDERGGLYLGATAPDIRVITRWERGRTHFFELDNFDEQDGVSAFFDAHPRLAAPGTLAEPTRAFVAGYLTHLVMDEQWITTIYRPYFGVQSALGGGVRANIMDRALQFSMDLDRRRDSEFIAHLVEAVARYDLELNVGFIDEDTLRHWRKVVTEMMAHEPDWERFRQGASRHLGLSGADTGALEEMLNSMPELVEEALAYLSEERVRGYLSDAESASAAVVKGYLGCG